MLIHGSQIRTLMVALVLSVVTGSANAQDDPSQRPLPLPERGVADLPQHMELLKRLRSLVESQQKNPDQASQDSETLPRLPELPSPTDSDSPSKKTNETTLEPSPFQSQQLQQLQDALKNLAGKLPPGFVPPDLSSVPPDQLRKAMENPAVQQQMKQMLEQFAKDGVLPKSREAGGSQLPVPPQNDVRQNGRVKNDGAKENESPEDEQNDRSQLSNQDKSADDDAQRNSVKPDGSAEEKLPGAAAQSSSGNNESATGGSDVADSASTDSDKDAPSGSMRSLRSFLKKLAEDAGIKSPDASSGASPRPDSAGSNSSQNETESGSATDRRTMPETPKNSADNKSLPSTRRPLRKRDSSRPRTLPPVDSSNSPAPDSDNNPAPQFPETSPQPLNRPTVPPSENVPDNALLGDSSVTRPRVPDPSSSVPPQGLRIDPESARKQLEELQKTLERMKQEAEGSAPGRNPTEEQPSSGGDADRSGSNKTDRSFDSNSVAPSPDRNDRMASRPDADNRNGEQLPESLPDVDEFLREQLRDFKLPPDAFPGNNSRNEAANKSSSSRTNPLENSRGAGSSSSGADGRMPIDASPRDLAMNRTLTPEELRRLKNISPRGNFTQPGTDPSSAAERAKSDKPPMDIAKELEQRGFGNTLKQLVERAKEEAKKPRQPVPDAAGTQDIAGSPVTTPTDMESVLKDVTGAAKKPDPELSQSVAKMLDSLKDDLVEIAKDARFNDAPQRARRDRSMNRIAPAESNSMIDTLRKSASEILAGPSRSSNPGTSNSSAGSSAASNAFSGEFDFTPVFVLAGVLAMLAIAFFGLRHFKFRGNDLAEFQLAGPPLKPSDINSRADVVRAFHEFALRSAQSVQSWWTHRTVQQAILEKAPEYRSAVETLANTYEQARYLPLEQELSPEQLESARSALQQCSRENSNG